MELRLAPTCGAAVARHRRHASAGDGAGTGGRRPAAAGRRPTSPTSSTPRARPARPRASAVAHRAARRPGRVDAAARYELRRRRPVRAVRVARASTRTSRRSCRRWPPAARLVLLPRRARRPARAPGPRRGVTVLDLPTPYWHALVDASSSVRWPAALRLVILGGEQVHAAAVTALARRVRRPGRGWSTPTARPRRRSSRPPPTAGPDDRRAAAADRRARSPDTRVYVARPARRAGAAGRRPASCASAAPGSPAATWPART